MSDYCSLQDATSYLGTTTFNAANDNALLAEIITRVSRMIDRRTGRAPGFWAAQQTVTRRYSPDVAVERDDLMPEEIEDGSAFLIIDPFQTITAVDMCTAVDRADVVTCSLDTPTDAHYVIPYPLNGPPYDRLKMAVGGFWPDVYGIGNVRVTGTTLLPDDLTHACCLWVAHTWKARNANWAGQIERPGGPSVTIDRRPPSDVDDILNQFMDEETRVYIY